MPKLPPTSLVSTRILALRHAEDALGQQGAEAVRRLDAGVEGVAPAAPVELAHRAARLEGRGGHAGDHVVEARDVGGPRE
ncbi:MAG TPA: hypothetical protein VJX92_23410, partial [Methylomirabilota bacterium]|nr:hypothetical protein [Methylomirabilota bacterium]